MDFFCWCAGTLSADASEHLAIIKRNPKILIEALADYQTAQSRQQRKEHWRAGLRNPLVIDKSEQLQWGKTF